MENIDELFRKTFREEVPDPRFPLDAKHWEQAKHLLEDTDRRKRRAFWLWWLLGLAGLLLSAGGYWLWSQDGKGTSTAVETIATMQNTQDNLPLSAVQDNNAPKTRTAPSTISTQIPKQEQPEKTPNNTQNQQPNPNHSPSEHKTSVYSVVNNQTSTINNQTSNIYNQTLTINNQQSTINNQTSNTHNQTSTINNQTSNTHNQTSTINNQTSNIKNLPLRYPILEKPLQPIEIQSIAAQKPMLIEAQPAKHLRFGLWAAGSAYRPEVDYGRWLGASVGLSVQRQFGRHWGLSTGLGWRMLPIQDPIRTDSVQTLQSIATRFSFGATQDVATATRLTLHSMELPLSLTWTKGIVQLEAGATLGIRTGVRATLRTEGNEPFADVLVSEKVVWLDGTNIRRFWVTPFAGLSATHRGMGLFVKAGLLPNSFFTGQNVVDASAVNALFRPYIDLGLNIVIQ
jgi:hypothetical protein